MGDIVKSVKRAILFFMVLYGSSGLATSIAGGVVNQVDVRASGHFLVQVSLPIQGEPACATDTTSRMHGDSNTAGGKALLAAALLAFSTGRKVRMEGTGGCPEPWTTIEGLFRLRLDP
jgi:hypothetical protein